MDAIAAPTPADLLNRTASLPLTPPPPQLGVVDLFDPALVNMTRITGLRGAAITTAVHKAHVSVSEQGTEASAATGQPGMVRGVTVTMARWRKRQEGAEAEACRVP